MKDLGTIGGLESEANAINDAGWVAGDSDSNAGPPHPFLWTAKWEAEALERSRRQRTHRGHTVLNIHKTSTALQKRKRLVLHPGMNVIHPDHSEAHGINDRGVMVGNYVGPYGFPHACIWYPTGGFRDLGVLPGEYRSTALRINAKGQVIGTSDSHELTIRYFLWTPGKGMRDLAHYNKAFSAYALNDLGQIAGDVEGPKGETRAAFLDPSRGLTDLGTLGGKESSAKGINNRGQVVGSADTAKGETHAFLWTKATGMRDLGVPGYSSSANDINDLGQVTGEYTLSRSESYGFFWSEKTGMITIKGLKDATDIVGSSINNRGQVAGLFTGSRGKFEPFVWTRASGMRGLGTHGIDVKEDPDINDRGEIVGYYVNQAGWKHGFIWIDRRKPSSTSARISQRSRANRSGKQRNAIH